MKPIKTIIIIIMTCLILPATSSFAQEETMDGITVDQIASKLRIFGLNFNPGNYLELSQGTLIEWDGDKKVRVMNVNGGDSWWSDLVNESGLYYTIYQTTEKKSGTLFELEPLFGTVVTTETIDNVECSGCLPGTSGKCQNSAGKCRSVNAAGNCPGKFSSCSETVETHRDIITVAFIIENWEFQKPTNTLSYEIRLQTRKDNSSPEKAPHKKTDSTFLKEAAITFPDGTLSFPSTAYLMGPDGSTDVHVSAEYVSDSKGLYINFEIPPGKVVRG